MAGRTDTKENRFRLHKAIYVDRMTEREALDSVFPTRVTMPDGTKKRINTQRGRDVKRWREAGLLPIPESENVDYRDWLAEQGESQDRPTVEKPPSVATGQAERAQSEVPDSMPATERKTVQETETPTGHIEGALLDKAGKAKRKMNLAELIETIRNVALQIHFNPSMPLSDLAKALDKKKLRIVVQPKDGYQRIFVPSRHSLNFIAQYIPDLLQPPAPEPEGAASLDRITVTAIAQQPEAKAPQERITVEADSEPATVDEGLPEKEPITSQDSKTVVEECEDTVKQSKTSEVGETVRQSQEPEPAPQDGPVVDQPAPPLNSADLGALGIQEAIKLLDSIEVYQKQFTGGRSKKAAPVKTKILAARLPTDLIDELKEQGKSYKRMSYQSKKLDYNFTYHLERAVRLYLTILKAKHSQEDG